MKLYLNVLNVALNEKVKQYVRENAERVHLDLEREEAKHTEE